MSVCKQVDTGADAAIAAGERARPFILSKGALAAAVPMVMTALGSVPLLVIASPLLLPVAIIGFVCAAAIGLVVALLAATSKRGR